MVGSKNLWFGKSVLGDKVRFWEDTWTGDDFLRQVHHVVRSNNCP